MSDEQKEPTIFDALRDGSLARRLFQKQDAPPPAPPTAPQAGQAPGQPAPRPESGIPQSQTPLPAPAGARGLPRFALRLSGGWLVFVVLVAFGAGFVAGLRWQHSQAAFAPVAPPTPDLSPQKQALQLGGQPVIVSHSALDIGSLPDAFDGNKDTLMRGAADNPFFFEMDFPEARTIAGIDITVATMTFFTVQVTLTYGDGSTEAISGAYENQPFDPTISFTFPQPEKPIQTLRVEIEDIREKPAEGFHIHVREVVLR